MAYGNAQGTSTKEQLQVDLGKNKRVSIRRYNGVNLVDIREYYTDKASGELKPGKKGISLTEESWNLLIENQSSIQKALDELSGVEKQSDEKDEGGEESEKSATNEKPVAKKRKIVSDSDNEEE